RQLVEATALEERQMIADDARGKRIVAEPELAHLDAQALRQVAGRDTWGIEILDPPEHTLDRFGVGPDVGEKGNLLHRQREVAVRVEAADDEPAELLVGVRHVEEAELPEQVVG